MALKYRKLAYRPWPVTVKLLECDEATAEVAAIEQTFIGWFKRFGEDDLRQARTDIFGAEEDAALSEKIAAMSIGEFAALEAAFFARLMCGWAGVAADDGADLPYSADALAMMCTGQDGPAFREAINRALRELRFGIAPTKNSKASPSPGPTPGAGEAGSAS